ncbi:putative RNA methyltransferase [Kaarinaea lacus]
MKIIKADNLVCPIDGVPLDFQEKALICENGHVFDIARQGYVNLLPVQQKRSKQPGDSKEMVIARSAFLNSGIYEPIAAKLADIVFTQITDAKHIHFLDAGCGEGYYFDYVCNYLNNINGDLDISFVGLDISKDAIAASAKRNKQITWVVGTNRQPPVTEASVDIILCVFGFYHFDGFLNILKSGGKVILVEPGSDHLQELREIIYTTVKKTQPPSLSYAKKLGFSMVDSQRLQFKTGSINRRQITNLLLMTPHFYRASKEGRAAAGDVQKLDLTVDVVFRTLEKIKKR